MEIPTPDSPVVIDQEVQVHLSEYQSLRSEINHYTQRIDRMSGVYLTVLFGIVGYLVRPDSTFDFQQYLIHIKSSQILTALFIFLPILNSLLLIRMGSFSLGILALSQYISYHLRPRLESLLCVSLLHWDYKPFMHAKRKWIPLRSAGQVLFALMAEALSIILLLATTYSIMLGFVMVAIYIISWCCVVASIISLIMVLRTYQQFHNFQVTAK